METVDISNLVVDRIACGVQAASKKKAIEVLSNLLAGAQSDLMPMEIFDSFVARERLGSTGLGSGVAIPHARFKKLNNAVGAFVQLSEGVDFDAIDSKPVDLLFALLVPENCAEEHLQILARLAEMFHDQSLLKQLRSAKNPEEMQSLFADSAHTPPNQYAAKHS